MIGKSVCSAPGSLHIRRAVNISIVKTKQRCIKRSGNGGEMSMGMRVGMIERFPLYFSPSMDERMVSVYLPEDYRESGERYPVMYMFDGQNAFEDDAATYGKSWRLHEFLDQWDKPMMLVGLQSSPERDRRLAEYCPFHLEPKSFEGLRGRGRATMDFLAGTLKPMIDARYRTLPSRACTGVMGGSLGAMMSLYAVTAYNDVFSKAACVSPSLGTCYAQLEHALREGALDPDTRVYLSWGEREARDMHMLAHITGQILTLTNLFAAKGARAYPHIQQDGRHCEEDWSKQTAEFMRFLWLE